MTMDRYCTMLSLLSTQATNRGRTNTLYFFCFHAQTVLFASAIQVFDDKTRFLISKGANLEHHDEDGDTALMFAVDCNDNWDSHNNIKTLIAFKAGK
jgi:hypothetical protein